MGIGPAFDRLADRRLSIPALRGAQSEKGTAVTDLVITATIAAGLFAGAVALAYDLYSTVVWRRQFGAQPAPVHPEPSRDSVVDERPAPAIEALSP
jgi:hypothetical protein